MASVSVLDLTTAESPAAGTVAPALRLAGPAARPERRIELPTYDLAAALELERELGVGHVVAQILVRRGHGDPAVARAFLSPEERHDPNLFDGIGAAIETIQRHIRVRQSHRRARRL